MQEVLSLRSHVLIALLLFPIWIFSGLVEPSTPISIDASNRASFSTDPISVRESNIELHVAVEGRIFVFGKAKGTLDKVKVGPHVFSFSQAPSIEGSESVFSQVSWKKLKDGSVQIQSTYTNWPSTLTWTVLANGQLLLKASPPTISGRESAWLGLGFNFSSHQLKKVLWQGEGGYSAGTQGQWENPNDLSIDSSSQELKPIPSFLFQQIQTVKLEFESVTVDVRTDTPGVFFGIKNVENQGSKIPTINSDLGFLLSLSGGNAENLSASPAKNDLKKNTDSELPLVLWFHFR